MSNVNQQAQAFICVLNGILSENFAQILREQGIILDHR